MRGGILPFFLVSSVAACALFAKSPALRSPLHERLAKADTMGIQEAAKACLTQEGWKTDELEGFAEGATVVSAKNSARDRVSVYIQPPEMNPRVTGGPGYDDPFWKCLAHELGGAKAAASAEAPSGAAP
jgi:hypothetical protein